MLSDFRIEECRPYVDKENSLEEGESCIVIKGSNNEEVYEVVSGEW